MKILSLVVLVVCVLLLAGCWENARMGISKDIVNHETQNIASLEPKLYKVNQRALPQRMEQMEETVGWQERMRQRMKAMKEAL